VAPCTSPAPIGLVPGGKERGRFCRSKIASGGEEGPDHIFLFLPMVLFVKGEGLVVVSFSCAGSSLYLYTHRFNESASDALLLRKTIISLYKLLLLRDCLGHSVISYNYFVCSQIPEVLDKRGTRST
jgi:hypothetical protein